MARSFNGSSDYINCSNASGLNPASITAAAWVYWLGSYTDVGAEQWFIARDDNTLGRVYALGLTGGNATPKIQLNGSTNIAFSTTMSANVWNHLAFTGSSAAGYTVYLNGVAGSPGSSGTAMNTSTGPTTIGDRSYASFNGFVGGNIGDVAIWNTVLSAAAMAALAKGARPVSVNSANLAGWWPLDGLQSPEPDLSGNANNGTLTGTALAFGPPIVPFTPRSLGIFPTGAAPSVVYRVLPAAAFYHLNGLAGG